MEQRVILYGILAAGVLLLGRLARAGGHEEAPRLVQASLVVGLAAAALLVPEDTGLFGVAVAAALVLLLGPYFLLRVAMAPGLVGRVAAGALPGFWWGQAGVAMRDLALGHAALVRSDREEAERRIRPWVGMPLPAMADGLFSLVYVGSALLGRDWLQVLRRVRETGTPRQAQVAAARALAELGRPAQALDILRQAIVHPSAARNMPGLVTAELSAYAAAGDVEAVEAVAARQDPPLPPLPPGWLDYWRGRSYLARGDEAAAHVALVRARDAVAQADGWAAQLIGRLLQGDVPVAAAAGDPGYTAARDAWLRQLSAAGPWLRFLAGTSATPVIHTIVAACMLLVAPLYVGAPELFGELLDRFANFGNLSLRHGEPYRLFTAIFLHANGVHLAFNALALLLFGRPIERTWGHATTLALFLLSGVGGHLASAAWHGDAAAVGASTGVYGLLAVYILSFVRFRAPGMEGFRSQRMLLLVMLIGADIAFSLREPRIDTAGHVGGLAVGLLAGGLVMFVTRKGRVPRAGRH